MCQCGEFKDIYLDKTMPPACPKCNGVMREDKGPQVTGYRQDKTMKGY